MTTQAEHSTYEVQHHISANMNLSFDELTGFIPDAIIILDSTLRIVYFNALAEEMFGYSAYEATGQDLDILIPQAFWKSHQVNTSTFLEENVSFTQMGNGKPISGKHHDGHMMHLDISITKRKWDGQLFIICAPRDISRQLAYQHTLLDSETRYRAMIDSQSSLIVRLDHAGRFIFANQAYCRMFGKTSEELMGSSFTPLVHPDDLDFTLDAMQSLKLPPYRITIEQRAFTTNGWRWIAWENSIIEDQSRNPFEIQSIGNDITERKQAEEIAFFERDLAISLAQKSTLDEALPLCLDLAMKVSDMDCGGIYILNKHSRNLELLIHKGLSKTLIEKSVKFDPTSDRYQMVMNGTPSYRQYSQTHLSMSPTHLNEGLRYFATIPLRSKGEVIACINVASHFLYDMPTFRREALENIAIHIGNMIARFQVQEALSESQNELKSMFNSLQDFIFILDSQGCIVQVNQMVMDSLGYSWEELIGKSVLEIHPADQRSAAWKIVQDMLAGTIDTCPLNLLKKDGTQIPVETRVSHGRWGNQAVLIGVSRDISDRKSAEIEIKETRSEIESFFTISQDLLCITDLQGNFTMANKAWEATLGHSVDELQKKNFFDFVHPDDTQATLHAIAHLTSGQKTIRFVNRYQCKNGSWRDIEWHSQAEGNHIYAVARDVTERKAAEDARQRQTRLLKYRQTFEEILTSISTRFISLSIDEINPEINQVLKQVGEFEHVDRSYVFLLDNSTNLMNNTHEWCAPGIEAQIDALKDLPISLFPWWMEKLKNLQEVHIPNVSELPAEAQSERELLEQQAIKSVLVVPLMANNTLVGFLGFDSVSRQRVWSPDSILLIKMVGDILSNALLRSKMENDLRQSEARNRALLSAVPDLIFRIRRDGVFLDFKASSLELLAAPPTHIIGASLNNILTSPVTEQAMHCIKMALQTKEIQTMEYTLKTGDSSHVFEARFKDSGADEVTAIIRDISDRARLEQMKSDFINRATHELRTPIATMLLMINLIDGGSTPTEYDEYWDVLKSELSRERILVEDLLSAGRLESDRFNLNFRSFEILPLIEDVTHQFEHPAREKNISISFQSMLEADDSLHLIMADEKAMTQVFMNLIGNALKFTPSGGNINISLERVNSGYGIVISDTGIGIPSEDLPLLFTRFFRGTNAIENEIPGTGIGLYIVQSILEKHAGKIKVRSELGLGTQFDIWLPKNHVE